MTNTQETRIQVTFRVNTPKGTYQDALWFTKEEYDKKTQAEIDVMKQERIDKWIKIVSTPTPELTLEDIQREIDNQQSMVVETTNKIQELQIQKNKILKEE